jgi:tetratricopeptide (TPR) repeat protein
MIDYLYPHLTQIDFESMSDSDLQSLAEDLSIDISQDQQEPTVCSHTALYSRERLLSLVLRTLARELRTHSNLPEREFALYEDSSIPIGVWIDAIHQPPTTTTQVNVCIIKPQTKGFGVSYAQAFLANKPHFLGTPTDFISHAWSYNFRDFVSAIEDESRERDAHIEGAGAGLAEHRFYWNDIFVEDQNATADKPPDYFFNAFRDAIVSIGRTILVLSPLNDAIALKRAWCVWEIFCTVHSDKELKIALPTKEKVLFKDILCQEKDGFEILSSYVSAVKAEESESFKANDKLMIHDTIRHETSVGGFHGVDTAICNSLRQCLFCVAFETWESIKGECKVSNAYKLSDFLLRFGQAAEAASILFEASKQLQSEPDLIREFLTIGNNMAACTEEIGCARADSLQAMILQLRTQLYGDTDEDTLASVNNVAGIEFSKGNISYAAELFDQITSTTSMFESLAVTHNRGVLCSAKGDLVEAETIFSKAIDDHVQILSKDNTEILKIQRARAINLMRQEDFTGAKVILSRVLGAQRKTLGESHRDTVDTKSAMGSLFLELSKQCQPDQKRLELLGKSKECFQETFDARKECLDPEHGDILAARTSLEFVAKLIEEIPTGSCGSKQRDILRSKLKKKREELELLGRGGGGGGGGGGACNGLDNTITEPPPGQSPNDWLVGASVSSVAAGAKKKAPRKSQKKAKTK